MAIMSDHERNFLQDNCSIWNTDPTLSYMKCPAKACKTCKNIYDQVVIPEVLHDPNILQVHA